MDTEFNLSKSVILRFVRAFAAGFIAVAAATSFTNIQTWGDLQSALAAIALSGTVGGMTGLIMAIDKWIRG